MPYPHIFFYSLPHQYILDIRQEVEADVNLMEAIADYFGQGGSVDSEKKLEIFSWLNMGNMIDGMYLDV